MDDETKAVLVRLHESLESALETLGLVQAQASAQQTLLITIICAMSEDADQLKRLKRILHRTTEGVQAHNLNTQLPDEVLHQQAEALLRLLPPELRSFVED